MNINIDVDLVLGDFVGAVCKLAGDPDRNKATGYNWFKKGCYDNKVVEYINHTLTHSAAFWQDMPLIEGALKGIEHLRANGHKITYVTMPYRPKYGWCWDRRFFLQNNFKVQDHGEGIIFTDPNNSDNTKKLIRADAFIDDLETNIHPWKAANPHGRGYLFASELNRQSKYQRVNWKNIINMEFFRNDQIPF